MEYRFLGKTGLRVSALCLGTMTFGRETSEADSHRMLDRFVEHGGNFLDTANVYSHGESEAILGRWLRGKRRDDHVIATKVRWPMGDGPNEVGLSRKHILSSVEDSLRRLQTDYIDLYQVHGWDPITPLEETLRTLNSLVRSGKVRYIGASNFSGWQLQKAIDLSRQMEMEAFVSLQPLYNLLDRSGEWELLEVCRQEGLGVIPWSPLRGGWLSGKFRRGMAAAPEGTRIEKAEAEGWGESWSTYDTERTWQVIDELLTIAAESSRSAAQVALRWLLQRPAITAPIIGTRTMQQLDDNLGATGWELDDNAMDRLTQVSNLELPYPYNSLSGAMLRR